MAKVISIMPEKSLSFKHIFFGLVRVGIIFAVMLFSFLLPACSEDSTAAESIANFQQAPEKMEELKKTACYSAASQGDCAAKLEGSELVTPSECCELFNLCC